MSESVTTDRINMALDEIIKDKKKKTQKTRLPVKSRKATAGAGGNAPKTAAAKAKGRNQRASSFNQARGIKSTTTAQPKNLNAVNRAKKLAMRARQHSRSVVGRNTGVVRSTASRKLLLRKRATTANPNETLKITVKNRGQTGKSSVGSQRLLQRQQSTQRRPRITQEERRAVNRNVYRDEASDRRASRFSAARGIPVNNARPNNRSNNQGANAQRGSRLRIGAGRNVGARLGRSNANNRNRNNNNNSNNNAGGNNNSNYDAYANFRSNKPRNRNNNANNRNNNRNANASYDNNTNNNRNRNTRNDSNRAPQQGGRPMLNDIFRQQNNQQQSQPRKPQQRSNTQLTLGDGNRPGRQVVVRR